MLMGKPGRCTALIETARQPGWRSRLVSLDHRKDASQSERPAGTSAADPNRADSNELWAEPLDRVMARLGTSVAGLLNSEAARRLALHGPNDPAATRRTPPWLQFLPRFRNPLVIILLVASALSAAAGDVASFLIVVTIIALSTTLDFLQEY